MADHDVEEARLHLADGDAIEAVVLDAQREGRVAEGGRLWHARLLGGDDGAGLRQLGACRGGVVEQLAQDRVVLLGWRGSREGETTGENERLKHDLETPIGYWPMRVFA